MEAYRKFCDVMTIYGSSLDDQEGRKNILFITRPPTMETGALSPGGKAVAE